ncbi:MAG: DUF4116 domain-containing protein [Bacilli bacterium]|nr:DUF4116 domain-containing protein [Bacilli bacterium]
MIDLKGEEFLNKCYKELHMSEEVMHTAQNKDSKAEKVHRYMDRLERVNKKAIKRKNDIANLKKLYHKKYVIKEENIPDYIDEKSKKQIIKDQEESLDKWLDYLLDSNSPYPTWAKYWVFQGMLKIGTYNEANNTYHKRNKKTINPFIEANPEVIAKCIDLVTKHVNSEQINDNDLEKLIESGSFAKIYTLCSKKQKNKVLRRSNINDGIWIKYNYETKEEVEEKEKKGIIPEYMKLFNSLQDYNTGWCTAGSKQYAKDQISGSDFYIGGDFYVYYTKDINGEYKVPRVAIRMVKNNIGEIRGVADESQNVEEGFENIIEEKLKTFNNITEENLAKNMKKVNDSRKLTELNQKNKRKEKFTEEDIVFLYELNDIITTFGWNNDEKIDKILSTRNIQEDFDTLKEKKNQIEFIAHAEYKDITNLSIKNKDLVPDIIDRNYHSLIYLDHSLRKDKELILEAIKRNYMTLSYADSSLKKDKDFILEATKINPQTIVYADSTLKNDKKFLKELGYQTNRYLIKDNKSFFKLSLKKLKNIIINNSSNNNKTR